jgi:hypothetical protein
VRRRWAARPGEPGAGSLLAECHSRSIIGATYIVTGEHTRPVHTPADSSKLTSGQGTRRARCGESRTPGSAGGPGKPARSNPGRASRPDPTTKHKRNGGPTSATDYVLLCTFHHEIAIHRWGWTLVLNPDGTTTAWNKDKTRVLHSHGPPRWAG